MMKLTYLISTSLKLVIVTSCLFILYSCGSGTSHQEATAEGFKVIEQELKSKFGDNAFYTDLKILYIKGMGNSISTTVTENPESLKMGEWDLTKNSWTQRSEITLEVPEGTKAADYMFQLNDNINLSQLGALVEVSKSQLASEKNIDNPVLSLAFVKFPKNGDLSKTEYAVRLEPETGGTSFSFYYTLDGELIKMDY